MIPGALRSLSKAAVLPGGLYGVLPVDVDAVVEEDTIGALLPTIADLVEESRFRALIFSSVFFEFFVLQDAHRLSGTYQTNYKKKYSLCHFSFV